MTLPEFLLARIAEDEADAVGRQWHIAPDDFERVVDQVGEPVADALGPWVARHIARHDPPRVKADCAAKRQIVEDWQGGVDIPWHVLALLALPYADHPDYDQEWKP